MKTAVIAWTSLIVAVVGLWGCGGEETVDVPNPYEAPQEGPSAGVEARCDVPAQAGLEDVSEPTTVVGDGTPESCQADAFVEAVAQGGVITFDCGPDPVQITLDRPAKVYNDASDEVVIDGGGKVTLSGGGTTRILYMNTCDEDLEWTTPHCDNQDHPRLTLQNITFVDGDARNEGQGQTGGGGALGANPAQDGTPGGGSCGAICNDGNTMTLHLCGVDIEENEVNEHGAGVFFVTNDRSGNIILRDTIIRQNHGGSWYHLPGISMHDDTAVDIDDRSVLED